MFVGDRANCVHSIGILVQFERAPIRADMPTTLQVKVNVRVWWYMGSRLLPYTLLHRDMLIMMPLCQQARLTRVAPFPFRHASICLHIPYVNSFPRIGSHRCIVRMAPNQRTTYCVIGSVTKSNCNKMYWPTEWNTRSVGRRVTSLFYIECNAPYTHQVDIFAIIQTSIQLLCFPFSFFLFISLLLYSHFISMFSYPFIIIMLYSFSFFMVLFIFIIVSNDFYWFKLIIMSTWPTNNRNRQRIDGNYK